MKRNELEAKRQYSVSVRMCLFGCVTKKKEMEEEKGKKEKLNETNNENYKRDICESPHCWIEESFV